MNRPDPIILPIMMVAASRTLAPPTPTGCRWRRLDGIGFGCRKTFLSVSFEPLSLGFRLPDSNARKLVFDFESDF
jgi:hypothetical protein